MGEQESNYVPDFIRDFSKEKDSEGRQETAQKIREKRKEYFDEQEEIKKIEAKAQGLQETLSGLEKNWVTRFLHPRQIKGVKTEMAEIESEQETFSSDQMSEARNLLNQYYEKQKQDWQEAGYEPEDVERYFTEENLGQLSLEDYGLMLSRFPSEMATHVTRQGIRDHNGMMEHRAGLDEYASGFTDVLKDGRLRSTVGKLLSSEKKEEAVAEYFKWYIDQVKIHCPGASEDSDRKLAEEILAETDMGGLPKTNPEIKGFYTIPGKYSDQLAVHLARNVVLDSFYGGEYGNEMFFAYPTAHLLADHEFYKTGQGQDKNNNVWIWAKNNEGLSVNAGLTFIPESVKVDRHTGSRYKLDENNRPIVDTEKLAFLEKLFSNQDFLNVLEKYYDSYFDSNNSSEQIIEKFFLDNNIDDPEIIKNLKNSMNTEFYSSFSSRKYGRGSSAQEIAEKFLRQNHTYYLASNDIIPSKEYWENYFSEHPEQKPSKIVYYYGSPSMGLERWKRDNGLIVNQKNPFDESYAEYLYGDEGEKRRRVASMEDYEEFMAICRQVLDKYFPEE